MWGFIGLDLYLERVNPVLLKNMDVLVVAFFMWFLARSLIADGLHNSPWHVLFDPTTHLIGSNAVSSFASALRCLWRLRNSPIFLVLPVSRFSASFVSHCSMKYSCLRCNWDSFDYAENNECSFS